jgi:hypothetical protein
VEDVVELVENVVIVVGSVAQAAENVVVVSQK